MSHDRQLHALGQSLWLDNISRRMLDDGTLARYVSDLSVTGLTSNPSIFEKAIVGGGQYDAAIRARGDDPVEAVFFDLALDDLRRAADLFRPVHDRSAGVDGWVSLEVSPLLADDAEKTIAAAFDLHQRARLDNLFIKIPGTQAGARAIEETIFSGVPVNVTLPFSSTAGVMLRFVNCGALLGVSSSRAIFGREVPATVVKMPPTRTLPSGCVRTDSTVPLAPPGEG